MSKTMMRVESNNRNCKAISKCVSLCLASCSFVQTDKEKKTNHVQKSINDIRISFREFYQVDR